MSKTKDKVVSAQAGWYVCSYTPPWEPVEWVPVVAWQLCYDPENDGDDMPLVLPAIYGAHYAHDYLVKSPEGKIGVMHDFIIDWLEEETEDPRIEKGNDMLFAHRKKEEAA